MDSPPATYYRVRATASARAASITCVSPNPLSATQSHALGEATDVNPVVYQTLHAHLPNLYGIEFSPLQAYSETVHRFQVIHPAKGLLHVQRHVLFFGDNVGERTRVRERFQGIFQGLEEVDVNDAIQHIPGEHPPNPVFMYMGLAVMSLE